MTDASENGHPEKLSPVEIAKAASNYLRGTIAEELRAIVRSSCEVQSFEPNPSQVRAWEDAMANFSLV